MEYYSVIKELAIDKQKTWMDLKGNMLNIESQYQGYGLYDSIYMTFQKNKVIVMKNRSGTARG